jgi:tetratricopeptide (TPR) repeat protein
MKSSKNLRRDLRQKPDDADLHLELGKAYYREKELDLAIDAYLKSLELDDRNPWVYLYLGNAYYHQHNYNKALDYFQKSSELMPDSATPFCCIADTYEKLHNYYQADIHYRRAVNTDPSNKDAHMKLDSWLCRQEIDGVRVNLPQFNGDF